MVRRSLATFFTVAAVLFALDWALGVARLQWQALQPVFVAVNLPSSLLLVALENRPPTRWLDRVGVDDEIGLAGVFVTMVVCQAALLTGLIQICYHHHDRPAGQQAQSLKSPD